MHRIGSFCHQTTPANTLGLISKVAEHLLLLLISACCAKAQQELSKSECQTGCVTSWSLLWYKEVHSGFDAGMRPVVSYVGRKKHSCSVAKQAIDGGNAAVAQKNVVQAEAIIAPASTMNTFWLHTWLHVLCIRVTHVNYTHIFFPSVEIAKPWYWRPVD